MSAVQLWDQPHHDGSAMYVSNPNPELGETVTVFLRVPRASGVTKALLRVGIDGEQALLETSIDRQDEHEFWLKAALSMENPVVNYRWLLDGSPGGYQWFNGTGLHTRDVTDACDFRLTAYSPPPDWASGAVLYQIFPDRFAKSIDRPAPDWAIAEAWGNKVIGRGPETPYQYFGGDLDGITARLEHIASLGADTVYLTPIFPARSNHRYDASSFDQVDPLLGGDSALHRLSEALHSRGMRLMGDLTTNHCGDAHEWFKTAIADPDSVEAGFFLFTRHPDEYVCWFGHKSLPKFNHANPELRRRLYEGKDSVVARWLGPDGFDGWRIDVANMTGRHGTTDLNHMVSTTLRETMAEADPEALLLAEHSHDASQDLQVDGWHGVMNYAGFTRPVWQWLKPAAPVPFEAGPFVSIPRLSGTDIVGSMRDFAAAVPWRATKHALNLVGSHDTFRISTMLGDPRLVTVAFGLLATMPGVPMLWAGDEIGQEGANGEDGRRPFPWDNPGEWDHDRLATTRSLFQTRNRSEALREGGLRWLAIGEDAFTFLRESTNETVLVHAARAGHTSINIPTTVIGNRLHGLAGTADLHANAGGVITLPNEGPAVAIWRCDPPAASVGGLTAGSVK
jgi:alpha-glucosidase